MISIVTAYYNRKQLFIKTLNSIKQQNSSSLLEVIAVDDGSDENERLEDLVEQFPFLKVIRLDKDTKWYFNSCIPFNIGFKAARGEQIILQNPECIHYTSILEYTNKNLKSNKFLSFACYSLDKPHSDNIDRLLNSDTLKKAMERNPHFTMDGEMGWYNHSHYRPVLYHFCAAITKEDLYDLGGFDERYALGIGGDDIELIYRIKLKGMTPKIIDSQIVLHQNHYRQLDGKTHEEIHRQKKIDYARNSDLFEHVTKTNAFWRVNYLGGLIKNSKANYAFQRMSALTLNISKNKYSAIIGYQILKMLSKLRI